MTMHLKSSTSFVLSAVAMTTLVMTGCGETKPENNTQPINTPVAQPAVGALPDFVRNPNFDPATKQVVVGAAGSSQPMKAGFSFTTDKAQQDARVKLARSLEAKIQSAFKDWTREGGEVTSQEDRTMALKMSENVSRTVTNLTLKGAFQKDLWQDPVSKEVFVWLVLDANAAKQVGDEVVAQTKKEMEEKKAHFMAKIEAEKAFADLDKLVDAELSKSDAK